MGIGRRPALESVLTGNCRGLPDAQPLPGFELQEGKLAPARFSSRHVYFIKRFVTI
jgi:hypothetical protein